MPHLSIRIDFDDEGRLGPGKVALLEQIDREGSISAAGRAMNMSYKRAWELVAEINRTFEEPLVTAQTGGQAGGGAALTPRGAGADPPLPRDRAQGAVGHRLASQGPAGDFPQPDAGNNALSSPGSGRTAMARIKVRKGMPSVQLDKAEFAARLQQRFYDPAFEPLQGRDRQDHRRRLGRLRRQPQVAAHQAGRPGLRRSRATSSRSNGSQRARPSRRAERQQKSPASKSRILLINGSPRSDQTCPGEMSKTFRLVEIAERGDRARARLRGRAARPQPARPRSTAARSIPARPASRRRCRSATGRAPAIPTIRSARSTTG